MLRVGFFASIAFNFLLAICYARFSISPKIWYAVVGYSLYLAFSMVSYFLTPPGYEHRGSLTADLFLCQYYGTTLWTMVIAYCYQELYSWELDDYDSKGRKVKGMKREDL